MDQSATTGSRVVEHDPQADATVGRAVPPRPIDARSDSNLFEWVQWLGLTRLIIAAVSVLGIVGGMWWLLRAPPLPVEQTLPSASNTPPSVTLPVPTTPDRGDDVGVVASSLPSRVLVHVAGNVRRPGVYELDQGTRVVDAIDAAGGATADGDLNSLNLASGLNDGTRIYVPAVGEVDPASVVPVLGIGPNDAQHSTPAVSPGPVNLNTADAATLETLPGVGPATAAAIVADRERNGPFATVDDLERVRGIGPAKLAGLIDLVTT